MQEQQPQDDSPSKAATRLLDDVFVEIVDVKGHVDDIEGSGWPVKLREQALVRRRDRSRWLKSSEVSPTSDESSRSPDSDMLELRSPEAERMALRATFAGIYYPKSQTPATSTFRVVIQQDPELKSNLSLAHAMDAVCLTEIGSAAQNQSYIINGTRHYQCALVMFRRELERAIDDQYFHSNLLATCHALMFCQRFAYLGMGDEGSFMHMKGLAHMMAARGLDSLTSDFDKLLLEDFQHYAMRLGMLHRRPVHSQLEKAWAKRIRASSGPRFFPQMCSLAFHLPGLLEQSDRACAEIQAENAEGKADACVRAMKLMAELGSLETTLQSWLQDWYSTMDQLPYRPVPVESFPYLQQYLSPELMDTFPSTLAFPSFASAVTHSRLWACLLLIRATSADLCSAVMPDERPSGSKFHNVTECADDLCLCLAYLGGTRDIGLAGPASVTGHLQLAYEWYEKTQDRPKMEWCRAIAAMIKARGLSTPDFTC